MKKIRHMIGRYLVTKIEPIEEDVAEEKPPMIERDLVTKIEPFEEDVAEEDVERSCHQNRTF